MNRSSIFMRVSLVVMVILMLGLLQIQPAQAQDKPEKSLYTRLGGYDAIAAVVDDFFGRLTKDPIAHPLRL